MVRLQEVRDPSTQAEIPSVVARADSPEALIEEARQRQRRRRLWTAVVVVVLAVASVIGAVISGGSGTPRSGRRPSGHGSPGEFVALAERGADGTFRATYDIPKQQGNLVSTITVAHQAPRASTSPESGSWMFEVDRIASGARYLWVSRPHSTAVCEQAYATARWSCEQTSMTGGGNGWLLAEAYYLPETELPGTQNAKAGSTVITHEVVAGVPVECLSLEDRLNGAHLQWCITASGVLASFSAIPMSDGPAFGGSPADGSLVSVSSALPANTFSIPAKPGPWVGPYTPAARNYSALRY